MLYELKLALGHTTLAALCNRKTIERESPTLLLLHGYLDNAASFELLIPLLEPYQCIAIDLAGHGKSEHRSIDAHYHLSDFAYDIYQLVNKLALTQFVLVGHSLGAIVSSIYSATQPSALRGFIAIESCGPLSQDASTTTQQLTKCFVSREKANKEIKHPVSFEMVVKARCAVSDLSTEQARQILSRNVNTSAQGKLTWRTDKRLRTVSPFRMTEEQACAVLANIKCDRALILGRNGFDKVKQAIDLRKRFFENVPTDIFEGGHHVHLDSPNEVAESINKYTKFFFKH